MPTMSLNQIPAGTLVPLLVAIGFGLGWVVRDSVLFAMHAPASTPTRVQVPASSDYQWLHSQSSRAQVASRAPEAADAPSRTAPTVSARLRPLHPGEVDKQTQWCRAMSTARKYDGARTTKFAFDQNVDSYTKGGGDMGFQHNHQYLSSESVVVEIGGNKGVFAQKMVDLYHPGALHVIEPVTPMVKKLKVRFAQHPEVHIHQFALAKAAGEMRMAYRSETDAAAKVIPPGQPPERGWEGATVETVSLLTFNQAWTRMGLTTVDLMNINIEGVEFQLVDALLASGAQARIRNLQIQFHVHAGIEVANKTALRCGFHRVLRQTHELVYNFDWVWEQWVLR